MKTIIVPTDFSDYAENALSYACNLAMVLKLKIVLFHAYYIPVPVSEVPVIPVDENEIRDGVMKVLMVTADKFKRLFPGLDFSLEASKGNLADKMNAVILKYDASYVVMGTRGISGSGTFLTGSNAARVMEHADCPVISIPADGRFTGMTHIVFAAYYGEHNFRHADELISFAKIFNADVTLLHVYDEKADFASEDAELAIFKNRLIEESKYPSIEYRLVNDKDVYHGINSFLETNKADLLIISMRNRSFLQKILSRSLTKRMAYHNYLPVMALHIRSED